MSLGIPTKEAVQEKAYERRWLILGVLCFSLLVIVLDNSILNVAIPSLQRELGATNSQLQWIVDSYTLVFAGLLLTAGSLGDRFGRRGALQFGFIAFGLGSILSALAGSADQLIATRAFMGIGGAFIMPATLSIITNVFPARERGRAIGVWAATAGVAIALGPLTGGFLLEHFYWGSVFLVNVPIVVVGVLAGVYLIPDSKDPSAPRLDPMGAVLSIAGLSAILYAIIEAPSDGWTSQTIVASFLVGIVLMAAFVAWEVHSDHPMLEVSFFKNPRFTAASSAMTLVSFAMFGAIFILSQYLQFTLGYTPLEAGIRMLPFAVTMLIVAPNSPRIVEKLGAKVVVAGGLTMTGLGLAAVAELGVASSYPDVAWRMALMAAGMALTMSPATESIMGALPLAKAGVGSAMNDTTRQVGGTLGVAIVGSVFSSIYATSIGHAIAGQPLPGAAADVVKGSIGGALAVAGRIGGTAGSALADAARSAFVDGMETAVLVAAGVAFLGAVIVAIWLPAHARREDVEAQTAEYERYAEANRDPDHTRTAAASAATAATASPGSAKPPAPEPDPEPRLPEPEPASYAGADAFPVADVAVGPRGTDGGIE